MDMIVFVVLLQLFATGAAAVGSRRAAKRVLKIELILLAVIEIPSCAALLSLSSDNRYDNNPAGGIFPMLIAVVGVVVVAVPLTVAAIRVSVLSHRDREDQPNLPPGSGSGSSGSSIHRVAEYGGEAAVYARIASLTDCGTLRAEFDIAAANHDRTGDRGAIGYMEAAEDRMEAIGCYPMPVAESVDGPTHGTQSPIDPPARPPSA